MQPNTAELLRYSVHFSGSAETSSPGKTLLTTKIRKPLTVRKALFGRGSVPLSMHG
jgi:hypothetical protein